MNILLIWPESDNESLWVTGNEGPEVRNNIAPLGLATVAGLTPKEFRVDIWDELVHGVIDDRTEFGKEYALVGITGFKAHLPRAIELAAIFRKRSIPVALGGPGVSATPTDYRDAFDILFVGEVEETWPKFLADFQKGSWQAEYRQIEKIDLSRSPVPCWDSIASDLPKYAFGSVQTTRGCPFDCEFCDVIYLYGRRQRHKPIEQVLEEVSALERLGMTSIFFCDDEFIGDPRYARDLLRALIPLNDSFARPLTYSTQLTMNLSKSDELLELMADANFDLVFIGIETPNEESLRETNKHQNIRKDLVGDVHRILSFGIGIRAGVIVGFDHDDASIFAMQQRFIESAFIPSVAINMLKAPWGTRLWARLRQEKRVLTIPPEVRRDLGHPRSYTTIVPKRMTRVELMQGYRGLLDRVTTWDNFADRVCGFVSVVTRPPRALARLAEDGESLAGIERYRVDDEASRAIDRILETTREKAPFMLPRMKALVGQHAKYRETIRSLLPQIDRQIELESNETLQFTVDESPIVIPSAFREAYRRIFDDFYPRVYTNTMDKAAVPSVLVDVFVDFLVRWGDSFDGFDEHHREFLSDLCDRTCARFNGQPPEQFRSEYQDSTLVPDVRRRRLDSDVMNNVEQILAQLAGTERGSGRSGLPNAGSAVPAEGTQR